MVDAMLSFGLDLSPAEKEVKEFYQFLSKIQNQAAQGSSGNLVTTPSKTGSAIANPQRVDGYNSSDDAKRLAAQRKMIENQAKLVALAQTEAKIAAQAAGRTVSNKELASVKTGALSGLGEVFQLSPVQKGAFTKAVNSQIKSFESVLGGLSGDELNNAFKGLADPILRTAGLAEASVQKLSAVQAANLKAEQEIVAANERRANSARQAADSDARDSQNTQAADQRIKKAKDKEAKAAEDSAKAQEAASKQNLKFTREKVNGQNTGDLVASTGPGERDRYQVSKNPAGGYGLTYPGRASADDIYSTQKEAKAAAEQHASAARQAAQTQAQSAAEAESTHKASKKLDSDILEEKKKIVRKLAEEGKVLLFHGTNARPEDIAKTNKVVPPRQIADRLGLNPEEANPFVYATKDIDKAYDYADKRAKDFAKESEFLSTQQINEDFRTKNPSLYAVTGQQFTDGPKGAASVEGFDVLAKVTKEEAIELQKEYDRVQRELQELAAATQQAASRTEALKPDQVIPGPGPKKDLVVVDRPDPIDVRSATEEEKRAHVQAYAKERARIAAEGTSGDSPIEAGVGQELRLAKEEEAAAARQAANIEREALAALEAQQAQQAAAERETTQAKKAEAQAAKGNAEKLKFTRDAVLSDGSTSYSAVSERTGAGYLIDKRGRGPGSRYEIFDDQFNSLQGPDGQIRSEKFTKLQDAKDYIQKLDDQRAANAAAQLAEEQKAAAAQKAEDVKQQAADQQITAAKTEQATAAKKLSAAQARAVNLVADGTAVTKDQLKEAGVKASTVRSLENSGAVTQKPDGSLQASDAAIAAAKQTQLAAVQRQTAAETQSAATATSNAAKEKELAALKDQLKAQVGKGLLTTQEANTKFINAGGRGNFNDLDSAVPVSQIEDKPRRARRTRDQIINDEEGGLVDALRRKIKALNAQARVLEQKYPAFSQAEALLIDALNRKARALQKQIEAMEAGGTIIPAPTVKKQPAAQTQENVPVAESTGKTKSKTKNLSNEKALGLDDFFDEDNADVKAAEEEADAARISAAGAEQRAAQERQAKAAELAAKEFSTSSADAIAAEEAADAARIASASVQEKAALEEAASALARAKSEPPFNPNAVAGTQAYLANADIVQSNLRDLRTEQILAGPKIDDSYLKKDSPKDFDTNSFDDVEAGQAQLAAAYQQYATLVQVSASEYFDEFVDLKAAIAALRTRIAGFVSMATLQDPYFGDIVRGKAETTVANQVIGSATKAEILEDPTLQQKYIQAKLENIGLTKAESESIARSLADDPAELKASAELLIAKNQLTAATLRAVRETNGAVKSEANVLAERTANRSLTRQEALKNPEYRDALRLDQINRLQERRARSGNPEGIWGKLTQSVGYDRSGGSSLTEFFGGGALSSLRYGLPSMLLFGAGAGISNTIREAEELQYNLARLEGQFKSTFAGQDFGPIRQEILDVAKDTGLAADEIANLQIQLTGAFGKNINIGSLSGEDLVKEQVASAARLAQTVGLPLAEITDGLTAASLAFGVSFEQIGDVALAIEQESGVLARETISFIGDIAPVAKEAGYSLEEFAAIAAVAQQRSGRSGTALAESFGRVIPAITEQKDKLLELASIDPTLATNDFIDAIRSSDPREILDSIGKSYNTLNKEAQQTVVTLLGGRREAQALIPALANQDLTERYQNIAENSGGTLEERFLKVRDTLTNSIQRITEAVRQLGVELLDAGLAEVFDSAITAAGALLAVLNPFVKVIGSINEALSNMPVNILLAVAAWKLLQRAITKPGVDIATGLPDPNAQRVNRFDPSVFTGTPRFVDDYRSRRGGGLSLPPLPPGVSAPLGYGQMPVGPATFQSRPQAFLGAAKTSGRGLLEAIGGGSALTGGIFVGITALGALQGYISGEISKAEKELEDLRAQIDADNEKLNLDDSSIRDNRVSDLRSQAEDEYARLEKWYQGWNGLLTSLNLVQSRAEVLAGEAEVLENFDPKVQEFFDSLDTSMERIVSDITTPTLGRGTRKFRDAVSGYGGIGRESRFRITDGKIENASSNNPLQNYFREDEQRLIEESARLAGVKVEQLDPRIVSVLTDPAGNPADLINQAANLEGQYADYGEEFASQANTVRQAFYDNAKSDKGIQQALDSMKKTEEDISKLDSNQLQLDELDAAFSTGVISLDEYINSLSTRLEERRKILTKGEKTDSSELELIKVLQAEQEANRKISDAIIQDQERLRSIAEAYGSSEKDLNVASIEANLANLRNPAFRDKDARLNAALQLIEAKKKADLKIAQDSGNFAEVARLLNEGSTVPPEARQAIYESTLFTTDQWKQLAEDLKAVEEISSFSIPIPKGGGTVSTIFNALGSSPEEIANKLLGEFFTLGTLSSDTQETVGREIAKLEEALGNESLTPEERAAIIGSVDGLIDFLKFVGLPEQILLDFLAGGDFNNPIRRNGETKSGAQKRIQEEYKSYTAQTPFGPTPEEKAKFDQEEIKSKEKDMVMAAFSVREARANRNTLLLAQIEKEKAAYELSQAQNIEDPLERQAAIFEAQAAGIKAQQSEVDALKALSDARFEFMKAVAQVNGDLIQVAQLEVQRLEAELRLARSSGDPNADAIAGQLLLAQDQLRKDLVESRGMDYDLFATYLESQGDTVNAALTRVKQAQFVLDNARGANEQRQAMIELINAEKAYKQAQQTEREAIFGLRAVQEGREDPVAQAKIALELARINLTNAQGVADKANAQKAVIDAQNQLEDAMANARISMFSLRQAELSAMDDQIGAAQVAVEIARQQLNDAIKQGQGAAAINNAKAQLITAEKQLSDTMINEKMEDYKWLLDMGQITQGQYVRYLESLQSTLAPGSKQFKDLALTIKQLKDGIQGDLQANLPTSFTLPTLYEVRRFDQTPQSGAGFGGIGYQDNRQVSVSVEINDASQDTAGIVLKTLEDALGTNRNGFGTRRF